MSIGKISQTPFLPQIDLYSGSKNVQKNQKPEVNLENKNLTAANSSEEVIMAVQTKKADERKPDKSKSEHAANLIKRVTHIEQVKKLSKELDAQDKQEKISQHIKQLMKASDNKVLDFVADAVNSGVEPAILLLSLKSLEKGDATLTKKEKEELGKVSDELVSEERNSTSIFVSLYGAKIASKYFEEDKELAAQLRTLVGKGNYEKLTANEILLTLVEASDEKDYDTLLKAYRDILSTDSEETIPSTRVSYLVEKSSRLNEISKVTSLMTGSGKMTKNLSEKHGIEVSKSDVAKIALEYAEFYVGRGDVKPEEAQRKIDGLMIELVKMGQDKKLYAANQLYKIEREMSTGHWDKEEERNRALDQLLIYSSRHSPPAIQGLHRMNKAFLGKL